MSWEINIEDELSHDKASGFKELLCVDGENKRVYVFTQIGSGVPEPVYNGKHFTFRVTNLDHEQLEDFLKDNTDKLEKLHNLKGENDKEYYYEHRDFYEEMKRSIPSVLSEQEFLDWYAHGGTYFVEDVVELAIDDDCSVQEAANEIIDLYEDEGIRVESSIDVKDLTKEFINSGHCEQPEVAKHHL